MHKHENKPHVQKKSDHADEQGENQQGKRDTLDANPIRSHGGNLLRSRQHSKTKQSGKQGCKTDHPGDGSRSLVEKVTDDGPHRGSAIDKITDAVKEIDDQIKGGNTNQTDDENSQESLC